MFFMKNSKELLNNAENTIFYLVENFQFSTLHSQFSTTTKACRFF
jgi:hypothetical protein